MRDHNYAKGAIVVACALRKYKTTRDIVCMVTPDISESVVNLLSYYFDKVYIVPYLEFKSRPLITDRQKQVYEKWISVSYTKFNCLNLTDYDRTILLDADELPLSNIDDLFTIEAPAAPFNHKFNKSKYIFKFGEVIPDARAVCKPISQGGDTNTLSADVVLLPCSRRIYNSYIKWMGEKDSTFGSDSPHCLSGSDEMSIARFFVEVMKRKWRNIPYEYAFQQWHLDLGLTDKPLRNMSYLGDKPWGDKWWDDFKGWWEIVDECRLRDLFEVKGSDFNILKEAVVDEFLEREESREDIAKLDHLKVDIKTLDEQIGYWIDDLPYLFVKGGFEINNAISPISVRSTSKVLKEWKNHGRLYIVSPRQYRSILKRYPFIFSLKPPLKNYFRFHVVKIDDVVEPYDTSVSIKINGKGRVGMYTMEDFKKKIRKISVVDEG